MKWVEALKEYAKKTGKYTVPKKGTPAYDEVKKMMGAAGSAAPATAPATAPAKQKARKVFEGTAKEEANKAVEAVKTKRAKKASLPVSEAMPALAAVKSRKSRGGKQMSLGGVTANAVSHTRNPEAVLMALTNSHIPIAPPAVQGNILADVKADVKKLSNPKNLPKLLNPEHVENSPAFSIQALRRQLGA